jgi:hypothetical protein
MWEIPIMAQSVTIAKHDKRKRLVLPDDFVAEAPYGEYIIREGKGRLLIIAIPAPKTERGYAATPALEKKLKEARGARELDCPPEFFTESLDD